MPDGGGRGHFATMAEMKLALDDHERRLLAVERDVIQLADLAVTGKGRPKRRRRSKPAAR